MPRLICVLLPVKFPSDMMPKYLAIDYLLSCIPDGMYVRHIKEQWCECTAMVCAEAFPVVSLSHATADVETCLNP